MEDLVQERIKRLHGDFLDPEGEFEVVSSLFSNKHLDQQGTFNEEETFILREPVAAELEHAGYEFLFYIKVVWSVVFLGVITWISFRWIDSSLPGKTKRQHESQTSSQTTSTVTKTTNRICTKATAKAFSQGNNLTSQFEQVMDQEEIMSNNQSERKSSEVANITATQQHIQQVETTVIDKENRNAMKTIEENVIVLESDRESGVASTLVLEHSQLQCTRATKLPQSPSRSQSPPPLTDEPTENPARPLHSQTGPQTGPSTPTEPTIYPATNSLESHPSSAPDQNLAATAQSSQQSVSPPYTPLKFDASLDAAMPYASSVEQTPQILAQEFCQNVEIIEQVLLRSSSNVDPSRAVDLAMMHQSSHMKMQQQQQRTAYQERRQSSMRHDKYDEYLKDLSKARDQCMDACSQSINYSMLVCVLLEGSRYAAGLMDALEYFSVKQAGAILLHMACGCEDDDNFASYESQRTSYIFMMSNFFLSTLESSVARFADYGSCALAYAVVFLCWQVVHGMLRSLHCPALLHQILNGVVLVIYLAQNPGAWIVVTRNLDLYYVWVKIQSLLTVVSFAVTMVWHVKTRTYLLSRQQQIQTEQKQRQDNVGQLLLCDAPRYIAHMEDVSWIIRVVPPMILGLVVLTTTEARV